jgi:hypothetical protein
MTCEGQLGGSGGGLGAEDTLKPRPGELNAHYALAIGERITYVDDSPLRFKIVLGAARKL